MTFGSAVLTPPAPPWPPPPPAPPVPFSAERVSARSPPSSSPDGLAAALGTSSSPPQPPASPTDRTPTAARPPATRYKLDFTISSTPTSSPRAFTHDLRPRVATNRDLWQGHVVVIGTSVGGLDGAMH